MENTFLNLSRRVLVFVLALTWPSIKTIAQDTGEKSAPKKTRIVIIQDEDGKVVNTDTMIMGDGAFAFGDMNFDFDFDFDHDFDIDIDLDDLPDPGAWHDIRINGDSARVKAYRFRSGMNDADREKLREEMKEVHEKIKADREKQKAEMKEALEKLQEEMKNMNRDELQKELEKLQEELLRLKEDLHGRHFRGWMDKDGGERIMCLGKGGDGMKNCLVIVDGDTIVCTGMAACKMAMAGCGGKERHTMRKEIRIRTMDDRTGDTRESPAPEAEDAVKAGPAPFDRGIVPDEVADRKTINGSDQKLAVRDLVFYPNPTGGHFSLHFTLDTPGKADIRLLDFAGRELLNETASDFPGSYSKDFDISGSAKGSYLLMIAQGDRWLHEKLVVN